MSKHSSVYYIYKESGFEAVEKAKPYKNEMGLDLFTYKDGLYEGQTGLRMCSINIDFKTLAEKKGLTAVNEIIQSQISKAGKCPRYTRPDEMKKDVFPKTKNENIIFAKDVYGKKHYYYQIYNENGFKLYTLNKAGDTFQTLYILCEGYMVEMNGGNGFDETIKWLTGLENGIKGEIERRFNESMTDPIRIADIGFANVLGRYDEAMQHNKPIYEARKLEYQKADAEREARRIAEETADKEKYEQAVQTAENRILNKKTVDNDKINDKSLIMQLFRKHEIAVPLKTQGWIIHSLDDMYYSEKRSRWSYHYTGNDSMVFYNYLDKLVSSVLAESRQGMTYEDYKKQQVNTDDLKIFFAFSNKQFDENLAVLNKKFNTNLEAKDLVSAFGGMVGVKEDITEFLNRIDEKNKKIPELFSPQEVYDYEFGNYECGYVCNDEEAIKIAAEYFGADTAKKIKRKYGYAEI